MALSFSNDNGLNRLLGDNTSESITLSSGQLTNTPGGVWVIGGNDTVIGSADSEQIFGNEGQDSIRGGDGNDSLLGGKGNDQLFGDAGNDFLSGDRGTDTLTGGDGADIFIIQQNSKGSDIITDYQDGLDKLQLESGLNFNNLTISNDGGNTAITDQLTGQVLATLQGVDSSNIDATDFSGIASTPPNQTPIPPTNSEGSLANAIDIGDLVESDELILQFTGFVGSNESDYYKFSLSRNRLVNGSAMGFLQDMDLRLLDSTGKAITESRSPGVGDDSIERELTRGTYYFEVFPGRTGSSSAMVGTNNDNYVFAISDI